MNYSATVVSLTQHATGCAVVGIYADKTMTAHAAILDKASHGMLQALLKRGDFEAKLGQSLLIPQGNGAKVERILLVGLGKKGEMTDRQFCKMAQAAMSQLAQSQAKNATVCLSELAVQERDSAWAIQQLIIAVEHAVYRFNDCKSNTTPPAKLKQIIFTLADKKQQTAENQAIEIAQAIAEGMSLTKTLGNLPGNICTPSYLAKEAQQLSKKFKNIKTQIIEENEMKKLGMNAFLSVTRGSDAAAKLVVMHYQGSTRNVNTKPIVLVGKGITFDSGGISLKPGPGMDEMKFDMCGAASVLGTLHTIARLKLPLYVIGLMACSENLPGGNASKPGDIVKTMSGQTVEILNTDAEGRLVLCDTLTYCNRFKPEAVINIATLTGAMIISLGAHATGMMSNNDKLAQSITTAGEQSADRVWRLPLWDEYQEALESNFADMANIGDRGAGSITAACFLSRFTKDYAWAHLDIAGTAWRSGRAKGATGRPVQLLTQYLLNRCNKA